MRRACVLRPHLQVELEVREQLHELRLRRCQLRRLLAQLRLHGAARRAESRVSIRGVVQSGGPQPPGTTQPRPPSVQASLHGCRIRNSAEPHKNACDARCRAAHLSRVVTALSRASLAAASSAVFAAIRPRSDGSAEPGSGAPPLVRTRPATGVEGDATLAAQAAASARASGTRDALMVAGRASVVKAYRSPRLPPPAPSRVTAASLEAARAKTSARRPSGVAAARNGAPCCLRCAVARPGRSRH